MNIPFNKPHGTIKEIKNIIEAIDNGKISGDGIFTKKCNNFFEDYYQKKVFLTTSCTMALEMAMILSNIGAGDEVIMPSYTFVSTANAVVLRGAIPVFVDIRKDTLNIDESLIERAISSKTKAIMAVHYAGVSCEMDSIKAIAKKHKLTLIEDAAQAFGSTYKDMKLGTLGELGCISFHETKNIISGEGGALIVDDDSLIPRAEIIREKGTNRTVFFRGEVDKYTWIDVGSSYLPSDIIAAYLYAQLEESEAITSRRMNIWQQYNQFFLMYEQAGIIRRPVIPSECGHNAHIYYLLFNNLKERTDFISYLKHQGIQSVFHYVPLHNSPAGEKFGKTPFDMPVTERIGDTLVRLPLYYDLSQADIGKILSTAERYFK
jgi:dTDP-4-amino-4,6-dideoxygalactose transaminase